MNEGDATLVDIHTSEFRLRSLHDQQDFSISGETVVGREKDCHIRIEDISISRYHAKLFVIIDSLFIEDLKSTNGTYVNGEKINERRQVKDGDEVRFHKQAFRITASNETDATLLGRLSTPNEEQKPAAEVQDLQGEQITSFVAAAPPPAHAIEEVAAQAEPEHTQVLSLQKLKALSARSAMNKNIVTVGSGPRLVVLTAPLRGKVFKLRNDLAPGTVINVGRGRSGNKLNILLEDNTISKDHAKLEKTTQGWSVKVSNAKNGMTINGEPARQSLLRHNDKLTMGRVEFAFLMDEANDSVVVAPQNEAQPAQPANKKPRRIASRVVLVLLVTLAVIITAFFALPLFR